MLGLIYLKKEKQSLKSLSTKVQNTLQSLTNISYDCKDSNILEKALLTLKDFERNLKKGALTSEGLLIHSGNKKRKHPSPNQSNSNKKIKLHGIKNIIKN